MSSRRYELSDFDVLPNLLPVRDRVPLLNA